MESTFVCSKLRFMDKKSPLSGYGKKANNLIPNWRKSTSYVLVAKPAQASEEGEVSDLVPILLLLFSLVLLLYHNSAEYQIYGIP